MPRLAPPCRGRRRRRASRDQLARPPASPARRRASRGPESGRRRRGSSTRSGRGGGRTALRAREVDRSAVPGRRPSPPRCDTPEVSRSRLVPLALMVTLLLAVVAIAARGRPLGSGGGGHGGLPLSVWDYVCTTVVILVVPLFVAVLFAAAFIRRQGATKRSYWQSMLRMLVFY